MQNSVLVHVPHASLYIPSFALDEYQKEKLFHEFLVMTDRYCDELFRSELPTLIFPFSRLYCDVERFREGENEEMSSVGMGAAYTRCSDGTELRTLTKEQKETILSGCYDLHHRKLERMTQKALEETGSCLIVDGHTFYPVPLPYELHPDLRRPDICIGTDAFHTPKWLKTFCFRYFSERGYLTLFNEPFIGTIVPLKYYGTEKRVRSVMIEINRKLYMRENGKKNGSFEKVKTDIGCFLDLLEKENRLRNDG